MKLNFAENKKGEKMKEKFKKIFIRKNGGSLYVKIPPTLVTGGEFSAEDVVELTYNKKSKVLEVVKA